MSKLEDRVEEVSALMDGETDRVDELIDLLLKEDDIREKWTSWQRTRDLIQGQVDTVVATDFSTRVMASIANDPKWNAPNKRSKHRSGWLNKLPELWPSIGGLAFAAMVAAVTVLSVDTFFTQPQQTNNLAQISENTSSDILDTQGTHRANSPQSMPRELNAYLTRHTESANIRNIQGMLPYVRLVGYGEQER